MACSKKAIAVSFLTLAFLVGCGDNEPSKSGIKKQISDQLSPCPELSISDFQKINGYPQPDGSYIDQIQYTLTFAPSDAMLRLLSDYDKSKQVADAPDASFRQSETAAAACGASYTSNVDNLNAILSKIDPSAPRLDDGAYASSSQMAEGTLVQLINDTTNSLQAAQQALAQNNIGQGQSAAQIQQYITQTTNLLASVNKIKAELISAEENYQTCDNNVQNAENNAQATYDQEEPEIKASEDQADQDDRKLYSDLEHDCPINTSGRGVLSLLGVGDDPDDYVKTFSVRMSGSVHLVKSDNGWVIQN